MEKESFTDPEIADYMNEHFVSVKVDREERPDIDAIYMEATQAMTGHGGWPMSVFLTPDGKPFFAGTYFPPRSRGGMPSFRDVLAQIASAWVDRREEVSAQSQRITDHIRNPKFPSGDSTLEERSVLASVTKSLDDADRRHGGFRGAPKFPQAAVLELLLLGASQGVEDAKTHLQLTLTEMARGGIYDQLGGGFHRYSTDELWLVPHFEKMLYDNAQLTRVYARAWKLTSDPLFKRVAEETAHYLVNELSDPVGAFHASEDADSEGAEGRFYVWSREEIEKIVPQAADAFGASKAGNFEGTNVLTLVSEAPQGARDKLFLARSKRQRPARDDKILSSWNGLAISALAEAGSAIGRDEFVDAAIRAADFVMSEMGSDGRLLHSWRDGEARVNGLLEDYAFMAEGLLALWEATFDPRFLNGCQQLCEVVKDRFLAEDGGFFETSDDHEALITRRKDITESATPSPASTVALVMAKLGRLLSEDQWAGLARTVVDEAGGIAERVPAAVPTALIAAAFLDKSSEIVIIGDPEDTLTKELSRVVRGRYLPLSVVAGGPPGFSSPIFEGKLDQPGPIAYVCRNYVCNAPTDDPEELARQLDDLSGTAH
jgi:hypothetical protein